MQESLSFCTKSRLEEHLCNVAELILTPQALQEEATTSWNSVQR